MWPIQSCTDPVLPNVQSAGPSGRLWSSNRGAELTERDSGTGLRPRHPLPAERSDLLDRPPNAMIQSVMNLYHRQHDGPYLSGPTKPTQYYAAQHVLPNGRVMYRRRNEYFDYQAIFQILARRKLYILPRECSHESVTWL